MINNAVYPGTFDPITYGHIDVIKKGLKVVDQIIVAISDGNNKDYLFSIEERISIVKTALFKDLKLNKKKIIVVSFNSLTTTLCKKYKSNIILRGLRAVSDFEYEFQLAEMNRKLNNKIETIFLMSDVENQIISSKFVKEIIELNGDVKKFITKSTIKSLKNKLNEVNN
ncbi:MAG: pantetheine-phosphate adenylyltransferase [Pelagibacterales bacterium]|nr:pantetheine-phosphate adenylyltransferase [Pelagibacterales bacterium]